jgi:hypothetical protein
MSAAWVIACLEAAILAAIAVSRWRRAGRMVDALAELPQSSPSPAEAAVAALGASDYADAIETLLPEDCDPPHRDRPSCPVCSARRTVCAAAAVVRETGDKRQRGGER